MSRLYIRRLIGKEVLFVNQNDIMEGRLDYSPIKIFSVQHPIEGRYAIKSKGEKIPITVNGKNRVRLEGGDTLIAGDFKCQEKNYQ